MSHELEQPVISIRNITKRYLARTVFQKLSVDIESSKLTLINGQSGSGKTTLLNMMSAVDQPDSGRVLVDGQDITALTGKHRSAYRAATGQIFQRSGLISGLTGQENIELVHELGGHPIDHEWTDYLLGNLGVKQLVNEPTTHLSGGQAQRIAVVRALAHRPRIVFADEPTASLDTESKHEVHETLRLVTATGTAVVMVSHEPVSAQYADRILTMTDGQLADTLTT